MNENNKHLIMPPPMPALSIADQIRLIGSILDQICTDFVEPYMTPLGTMSVRCRFCKTPGVPLALGQMSIPHPDTCGMALNAQLQASLKPIEKPPDPRFFGRDE